MLETETLSNEELLERLPKLCSREREAIVAVLEHLVELDNRRLYLAAGYSSLFDYCRRKLLYSEGGAQRRILAARCLRDRPELGVMLKSGEVTLCTIATAAKAIREDAATIEEIVGKSKREVELLVAKTEPRPKPRERVKPLVLAAHKAAEPERLAAPKQEERFELRFSVTREVYARFEEAKSRLSNALGGELGLEAVFVRLLDEYLKPMKERARVTSSQTRYVPAAVKREVQKRDGGQCSYVASDGTRCTERFHLQYDHVLPFAVGGTSEAKNLRLRCAGHNRLAAEQFFGKQFMAVAAGGALTVDGGGGE